MEYEDIVKILKVETFGNLVKGGSLSDLYWIREEAVPALLDRIGVLDAQIEGLKEAIAREGAMNQESVNG